MSILTDVKDLYGTLETTWADSRAHAITHVTFVVVILWFSETGLPHLPTPSIDPKAISENDWFKLAKDTGVVYVALLIPIIALSIYSTILRVLGQIFLSVTSIFVMSGRIANPLSELSEYDLEPLALLVGKEDFKTSDLMEKAALLTFKYQSKKSELWTSYQKTLTALTQSSVQYFGDFSVFLLGWIIAFKLLPNSSWVTVNHRSFWPVTIILLILVSWSWLRVSRVLRFMPRLQLQAMAALAKFDPDTASLIETPRAERERVVQKLRELLGEERQREMKYRKISFREILLASFRPASKRSPSTSFKMCRGWPFAELYRNGERLIQDMESPSQHLSAADIAAYLYYSFYERASRLAQVLRQLIKYFLFGTP